MPEPQRIEVENVNHPGQVNRVRADMYAAMKAAILKALPQQSPGLTQQEMFDAVLPHLPEALFPGGAKAGWWAKTVQLDLEAKGLLVREMGKPLRWYLAE
mgnify:CR=1 FL=1